MPEGRQKPRRVVLLSYYYHPVASVGSIRAGALAKYLPEFGWEATIVTPRRSGRGPMPHAVIETADSDLAASLKRKLGMRADLGLKDQVAAGSTAPTAAQRLKASLIETAKGLVAFPDSNRGWVRHAVDEVKRAAGAERFDAVLSTSPPASAHLAGRRICRELGVGWVADLRDLWSEDHHSRAPGWRRALDRRLEVRTFRDAGALVTVSEPLAAQLRKLHPATPAHAILNGFDPALSGLAERPTADFTITHTGTFYQGRRDPTPFFEGLAEFLRGEGVDRARVRVRMFSRQEPWLPELVARLGLADVVEQMPWVPWEAALRAQQESQVLVLLHWGGEREVGVYTGKVFEYLAARRPILLVGGGPGVLPDLIARTGAGTHVHEAPEVAARLRAWWDEYRATGSVTFPGDERTIESYSHVRMAREFAAVLDSVTGRRA